MKFRVRITHVSLRAFLNLTCWAADRAGFASSLGEIPESANPPAAAGSRVMQRDGKRLLYVSGEESESQTRCAAIGRARPSHLFPLTETCLERILESVNQLQPEVIVLDSVHRVFRKLPPGPTARFAKWVTQFLMLSALDSCFPHRPHHERRCSAGPSRLNTSLTLYISRAKGITAIESFGP